MINEEEPTLLEMHMPVHLCPDKLIVFKATEIRSLVQRVVQP